MRMSFYRTDRMPAVAGAFCLTLATFLTGCATRNPLIDEPVAVQAAPETAASMSAANTNSGVVTTGPTGARRFFGIFSPYRIDIQQGNFVSREMVAQLQEGMKRPEGVTRDQVRFVLGTPLLADMFHTDRWDYVFRLQKGTGQVISSRVTVFFKDDRLAEIDSGTLPTEQEYLAYIAESTTKKK